MSSCNQIYARSNRLLLQATLALALLVVLCVPMTSAAQHHGGGGGGFGGGGMAGGGMHSGGDFPHSNDVPSDNNSVRMRGGLQVGPPSRWWDDKHYVKQLHLSQDQQRHMDAIFEQNRPTLLKRFESLEQEELRMETLTHAKTLDESAMFSQIDRVAQARADLEKANTHYLFQIRNELDADQIARLEAPH